MKKHITASFLLWALVSCSNITQLPPTAVPTSERVASPIPTEMFQSLLSAVPTLDAPTFVMPDPGDTLDPQSKPVQEWHGFPIMPEAIAGQEFANAYSFRVDATAQEVQAFYDERLTQLGWSQPFDSSFNGDGGTIAFRKEQSSLSITVTSSEDSVVVLLVLTQV